MKPLPRMMMLMVGLVSGVVAVSALAFGAASLFVGDKPFWMIFGFECVTAIAGVLGMLFARGRYQEGQGLGLACIAMTIAVGAFLAWLSVQGKIQVKGSDRTIGLNSWLLARVGASMLLGAVGCYAVLSRNPRSMKYLVISAVTAAPVLAALAGGYVGRARIMQLIESAPFWITTILVGVLGVVAVALVSAAAHCLIRAFEMGRPQTSD